jgi:single-strand DNA-binding protein
MYLNKVQIIGNLTRDPEMKALPSGMSVTNFGVATNRTWKDKNTGEKKEEVEYHNLVAFGKQAEIITQYMSKGSQVYVEGRLQTRSWDKDGQKMYRTEIVVEMVQFGKKTPQNGSQSVTEGAEDTISPEDIPF